MPSAPTFLARFGLTGLRLLAQQGHDVEAFGRALGLPSPTPERLPSRTLDAAMAQALAWTQNPDFGLHAGGCWHPSDLGALGYAWLSSDSLRTGLQRLARYMAVLGERMHARCEDAPTGVQFVYDHGRGDTPVGHALARFELSVLMAMVRLNLGPGARPAEVRLRAPKPAAWQPYEAVFDAPVRFGSAHDAMVFPQALADQPLDTAQRALAQVFDEHLARELAGLARDDVAARCRAWLLSALTSGTPSEAALARAMGLSGRSLHRRLHAQGTSYRQLLVDTRFALAQRYLSDPARSVTEVTYLLGFSEHSAFTRAFRRWSGESPSAFRARQALPMAGLSRSA